MLAYELLARCLCLTLTGINEDGELEWIGTAQDWQNVEKEEQKILAEYEFNVIWR